MTQDDSTICQTPIESVPVRVRVHGLADAHSRPLVAWGKVNGKHRGSWRTSPARAWNKDRFIWRYRCAMLIGGASHLD